MNFPNNVSSDRGHISGNQVSLTSFQSDPPTFTLLGATSGGPPTTYTWTRNSQVITNSASYSISIQVVHSPYGFQDSRYLNTLTVTGRLPGVYQYSVTNRATSGMVTGTFTIESKPIITIADQHFLMSLKILEQLPENISSYSAYDYKLFIQVVHLLLM